MKTLLATIIGRPHGVFDPGDGVCGRDHDVDPSGDRRG